MTMVRTECLRESGGFDVNLYGAEDRDLWLRLARRSKLRLTEEPLAMWRKQQGSLTTNDNMMLASDLRVFEKVRRYKLNHAERALVHASLATCHFDLGYKLRATAPLSAVRHLFNSLRFGPFRPRTYRALCATSIKMVTARIFRSSHKESLEIQRMPKNH
jgi:hypothetical protein